MDDKRIIELFFDRSEQAIEVTTFLLLLISFPIMNNNL